MSNETSLFDEVAFWYRIPECQAALRTGSIQTPLEFYEPLRVRGEPARKAIAAAFRFDEDVYLYANPDIRAAVESGVCLDGLDHWLMYGRREERERKRPSWRRPLFDSFYYLRNYPDVRMLIKQGLFNTADEHWILAGQQEVAKGLRPVFGGFDEDRYLTQNQEVAAGIEARAWTSGYDHWLSEGRWRERHARVLPHNPEPPTNRSAVLSSERRSFWERNGFVIIERAIDGRRVKAMKDFTDSLWLRRNGLTEQISADIYLEHPGQRRVLLRDAPDEARSFPYKINDLYLFSQTVWDLALDENVVDALLAVLGGDPTIVTSLNFERGSQQGFHTDTLYMPGIIERSMTAAWFALEDVDSDSGPLVYYPGSQKIPRFLFSNKLSYQIGAEMSNYHAYMAKNIAEHGLKPVEFLPRPVMS
jgi:ectoine hydroxylase-related dioxygenase (phytanoyl-CoA dioxygenase family)